MYRCTQDTLGLNKFTKDTLGLYRFTEETLGLYRFREDTLIKKNIFEKNTLVCIYLQRSAN